MMINTEKLEVLEHCLESLIVIITNQQEPMMVLQKENNNYIEYKRKGDRYENLSPKEYLNVIRPYLTDLITDHKPTVELNNNNNNKIIVIIIIIVIVQNGKFS